uniref:GLD-3 KH5 domain-containing protein n=1 Tax=Setaria digitata TaxID=48799 RepID=A0A915PE08_9BILA
MRKMNPEKCCTWVPDLGEISFPDGGRLGNAKDESRKVLHLGSGFGRNKLSGWVSFVALKQTRSKAGNLNWMYKCLLLRNMPIGGHWALRGGFAPRANPRRPNAHFPQQDMFRQPRTEFFISFYHRSQESAKMFDAMRRRVELAYEQRRKSETSRLQKTSKGDVIQYLERIPLSKNVTLTIEVPNGDHAGMLERMEAWCDEDSIPQIMQDTGVLIQFPDLTPDGKNGCDYVNRVTLTGPLANVEQARIRIRNFTPVAITFPLRTLKSNILMKDVRSIIDKAIADKLINFPNLEIMVQLPQLSKDPVPSCVVRGAPSHERDICDACTALHRLLFDAANDSEHSSAMIYSTMMDIPAVQQLAVTGVPDGFLIRLISLETNAVIYFPTVADRHFGATAFYLYGSVHAIMRARKFIQGLLPVRLIFDVENDDLLCPIDASNRELFLRDQEHDLTIMMKKSRLEGEKLTADDTLRSMVVIESEEYNLTNVYSTRHQLLRNSSLEDEPMVVTEDFDFFERDFKSLIAKNNQVIAESLSSKDSLVKTSSLISPQLKQDKRSSRLISSLPVSSPAAEPLNIFEEVQQSPENENTPADNINLSSQGETAEEAIRFSGTPPSTASKEQNTADGVNMSVPEFMDLFRQNEDKNVRIIPINDAERPLSEAPSPRKVEYNRTDSGLIDRNFNEKSQLCKFDIAANKVGYDSTCNVILEKNVSELKHLSEKTSACARRFPVIPRSQDLMSSGANVVDALISEQGSTTVAVAAAMLQNSPPQWFQSSGTMAALKSANYFERMPRVWDKKAISATFTRSTEVVENSKPTSEGKTWQTKKNLPLKSSFTHENYIHEYRHDIDITRDMPQDMSIKETREASSDVRLSLSNGRNNKPTYSVSRGNTARNSNQHRLLHQNSANIDNSYGYRKQRQAGRTHDNTIWENSRHSSPFHTHSNTREVFSRKYRGRITQNSSRFSDMGRGGRTIRQSTNHSAGYYSTFSRSQSTWSLSSSGHGGNKRFTNRTVAPMRMKRQFVNGAQLEEKGKGDRREERCPPLHQEQHSSGRDQKFDDRNFRKEPEELTNNVANVASPPKLLVKTKTYADITKRIDVMVVIDEAQRSKTEQSSRSVHQLNSPFHAFEF